MKTLRRLAVIVSATALVAVAFPATTTSASTSSDGTKCFAYKDSERAFARKINAERDEDGVDGLKLDRELSKAARKHTREMAEKDELYHTPDMKLVTRVTNWTVLGENVGVGSTVESLHDAFMASPGHRDNILWDTYRHVGIGVKTTDGKMWVTVIFEAKSNPGTTLNVLPSC